MRCRAATRQYVAAKLPPVKSRGAVGGPARAAPPPLYLDQLPRWAPSAGGLKACFVENFAPLGLLVRGRGAPGANRQSNESIFHDPDAIFHQRCAHSQKNSTTSVAVA